MISFSSSSNDAHNKNNNNRGSIGGNSSVGKNTSDVFNTHSERSGLDSDSSAHGGHSFGGGGGGNSASSPCVAASEALCPSVLQGRRLSSLPSPTSPQFPTSTGLILPQVPAQAATALPTPFISTFPQPTPSSPLFPTPPLLNAPAPPVSTKSSLSIGHTKTTNNSPSNDRPTLNLFSKDDSNSIQNLQYLPFPPPVSPTSPTLNNTKNNNHFHPNLTNKKKNKSKNLHVSTGAKHNRAGSTNSQSRISKHDIRNASIYSSDTNINDNCDDTESFDYDSNGTRCSKMSLDLKYSNYYHQINHSNSYLHPKSLSSKNGFLLDGNTSNNTTSYSNQATPTNFEFPININSNGNNSNSAINKEHENTSVLTPSEISLENLHLNFSEQFDRKCKQKLEFKLVERIIHYLRLDDVTTTQYWNTLVPTSNSVLKTLVNELCEDPLLFCQFLSSLLELICTPMIVIDEEEEEEENDDLKQFGKEDLRIHNTRYPENTSRLVIEYPKTYDNTHSTNRDCIYQNNNHYNNTNTESNSNGDGNITNTNDDNHLHLNNCSNQNMYEAISNNHINNDNRKIKYSVSAFVNLSVLKLLFTAIYLITKLGCYEEIFLNRTQETITEVNKELLLSSFDSNEKFEQALTNFESKLKFEVVLLEVINEGKQFELPFQPMNNDRPIIGKKNDEELYLKFKNLDIHSLVNSCNCDRIKFRLYISYDDMIRVYKDGNSYISKGELANPMYHLRVKQLLVSQMKRRGTNYGQIIFENLNFDMITPNKKFEQLRFDIELSNGKFGYIHSFSPNFMKFSISTNYTAASVESLKYRIKYLHKMVAEGEATYMEEYQEFENLESQDWKKKQPPTVLHGNARKKQKKSQNSKNLVLEYEKSMKNQDEEQNQMLNLLSMHDTCGFTLLHISSFRGFTKLCKFLLVKGLKVNILDNFGYTPWHWACYSGNKASALLLLDRGASINVKNFNGKTGLDLAKDRNHDGLVEDIDTFLERSAIFALKGLCSLDNQNSELLKAVCEGDEELVDSLIESGALIDTSDEKGNTALHIAVLHSQVGCMETLIRHGAALDVMNNNGHTALHIASSISDIKAADVLISSGKVDIDILDREMCTPLLTATYRMYPNMVKLLLERGANVNAKHVSNHSKTPLHIAAENAEMEIIKLLLEFEASITITDDESKTPLDRCTAKTKQYVERIIYQIKKGKTQSNGAGITSANSSGTSNHRIQPISKNYQNPKNDWDVTTNVCDYTNTKNGQRNMKSPISPVSPSMTSTLTAQSTSTPSLPPSSSSPLSSSSQSGLGLASPSTPLSSTNTTTTTTSSSSTSTSPSSVSIPSVSSPLNTIDNHSNLPMELLIKPSRKKRKYISFFPKELCSSPYKYDILLKIPLSYNYSFNENQFQFKLLIQGVDLKWNPVDSGIKIVKYLRTMFPPSFREIEWRIMFKVCSFHYHRKPFKFQVIHIPDGSLPPPLPTSTTSEIITSSQRNALNEDDDEDKKTKDPKQQRHYVGKNDEMKGKMKCNVVFESQLFWIVARKKKENDFWGNNSLSDDETEESTHSTRTVALDVNTRVANSCSNGSNMPVTGKKRPPKRRQSTTMGLAVSTVDPFASLPRQFPSPMIPVPHFSPISSTPSTDTK